MVASACFGITLHLQGAFLVPSETCSIEKQSIEYCGWVCLSSDPAVLNIEIACPAVLNIVNTCLAVLNIVNKCPAVLNIVNKCPAVLNIVNTCAAVLNIVNTCP